MIESPPPEILDALRRMGLLATSTDTCGERLTGGVSSDIWRIDLPAGPDLRQARAGKAAGGGGLAGARSSATATRHAGCSVPTPRFPGRRRNCWASTRRPERWRCSSCRRTAIRSGRRNCATATPTRDSPRRSRMRWCGSTRRPPLSPSIAADFPTDRIFYDIRLEPYLVATARAHPDLAPPLHGLVSETQGQQACAGAWRCQPEEHPARPGRPGVPGCRVRLVGRSGVRSGVLPQSPAAEVPVDTGCHRRLPRLLRCARRRPIVDRRRLGAAGRAGGSRRAPAAGVVPRPGGWQVAGRVHHHRAGQGPGAAHRSRTAARTRSRRLGDVRQAWTKELAA